MADAPTPPPSLEDLVDEVGIRSIDVCAFCGDCECDGTCMSDIDANEAGAGGPGDDQYDRLERLHDWLRWGQAWETLEHLLAAGVAPAAAIDAAERRLADAENRLPRELCPGTCPSCGSDDRRYRFGSPCFDEWHRPYGPPADDAGERAAAVVARAGVDRPGGDR